MESAYPRLYPAIAAADLVLDLAFDEGAGQRVLDSTPHNNHGIMQNMEEADWVVGPRNKGFALDFDGVNEYVLIPDSDELVFGTHDFSICAWFYCRTYNTARGLIAKRATGPGAAGGYWQLTAWDASRLYFYINDGLGSAKTVLATLFTNTWYYVVAVAKRVEVNGLKMYIDSVVKDWETLPAWDINNRKDITIGYEQANDDYWDGKIAGVRLYNRALTASEVLRLYEQERQHFTNAIEGQEVVGLAT